VRTDAAGRGQHLADKPAHVIGDLVGRTMKIGVLVVGAEQDNDEIKRQEAGKRRRQIGGAVQPWILGIVEAHGTSA
jgi:hypothetical protein